MGDGEVTSPLQSFTQVFDEVFPAYLAMGMSYEQFWLAEPELARAYRKADAINRRRQNEWLWVEGMYTAHALSATVGNMFSKGNKHQYPSEPIPITEEELTERKEREQRAKMERIKSAFTARALALNTRLGGVER